MMRLLAVAVVACSSPAPRPVTPPPLVIPPTAAVVEIAEPPRLPRIVVKASRAASRQPERPRVLAALLHASRGHFQIPVEFPRVGLAITEIVSGTLDDPDYANRPLGANHLPVVLLDEAAFAAPPGLAGFEGTWTLSRRPDGTLTVSSIDDTPFAHRDELAGRRAAMLSDLRAGLTARSARDRLAALARFERYAFYELVPEVIALLGDDRPDPQPPRESGFTVGEVAAGVLTRLLSVFGDERMPGSRDVAAWSAFWGQLLQPPAPRPELASEALSIATVAMNQSWPGLAALPEGGFALAVSRMTQPLDGHTDGLALTSPPFTSRTWSSADAGDALDAVPGPEGATAVLHVDPPDRWKLALQPARGPARLVDLPLVKASHAALGATARGYVVAFLATGAEPLVRLQRLDATGKPAGPPVAVALPGAAANRYHHGVFPVALAKRPGGWFVVVETSSDGIVLLVLDEELRPAGATLQVADRVQGLAQAKIAVGRDRALLTWVDGARGRAPKLGCLVVDLGGKVIIPKRVVGFDVDLVARPIALDDGFATAWIAGGQEVHVGRWNEQGLFAGSAMLQERGVAPFALAVSTFGKDLLIGYEDVTRYPFALVARRVDPAFSE